jgi:hypothetical protein
LTLNLKSLAKHITGQSFWDGGNNKKHGLKQYDSKQFACNDQSTKDLHWNTIWETITCYKGLEGRKYKQTITLTKYHKMLHMGGEIAYLHECKELRKTWKIVKLLCGESWGI